MPSPLGHAIGGLIAGWTVTGAPAVALDRWRQDLPVALRQAAPLAVIAMLPDLDLLVGLHSRYTHSLGAAGLAAAIAAIVWRRRRAAARSGDRPREDTTRLRFAIACGLAYASHVLLDWLGTDTSPPRGIMALWPWSSDFYQANVHWFLATDRRYWLPGFVARNLAALLWELITLVPLLAATAWLRRPSARRRADRDDEPTEQAEPLTESRGGGGGSGRGRGVAPPRSRTQMRKSAAADVDRA